MTKDAPESRSTFSPPAAMSLIAAGALTLSALVLWLAVIDERPASSGKPAIGVDPQPSAEMARSEPEARVSAELSGLHEGEIGRASADTIRHATVSSGEIDLGDDKPVALSATSSVDPGRPFMVVVLETSEHLGVSLGSRSSDENYGLAGALRALSEIPFSVQPESGRLDETGRTEVLVRKLRSFEGRTFDLAIIIDDDRDDRFTTNDVAGVVEVHE